MAKEGLRALRTRVNEDPALARRLRLIDPERFATEVARIAAASGIEVTASELEEAIAHGRQAWALRWIL